MDKKEVGTAVRSIIRFLEAIGSQSGKVYADPYHFDQVVNSCERRARFLRSLFCVTRNEKSIAVRRRLVGTNGKMSKSLRVVGGVPYLGNRRVYKPNGQPWSFRDVEVELRQRSK